MNNPQVDVEEVLAYWTPQRMAAARPAKLMLPGEPSPPAERTLPPGPPGAFQSSTTGEWPLLEVGQEDLIEYAQLVELPSGYSYPPPENTWAVPVAWYGSFPIRTVGKVYYTNGGQDYVASGAAVGNRAVMTTAGVVHGGSGGSWSSNMIFIPALRNSWKPYGTWVFFNATASWEWVNNSNLCRSIAFFVVSDQGGKTLAQKTGALGFMYNAGTQQAWTAFGYSAGGWSGNIMVATNASYAVSDSYNGCSPAAIGIGTRQNAASFGGPWIYKYRAQQWGSNNYTNGVFCYAYVATPNQMFSAYVDTNVYNLWSWAVSQ